MFKSRSIFTSISTFAMEQASLQDLEPIHLPILSYTIRSLLAMLIVLPSEDGLEVYRENSDD